MSDKNEEGFFSNVLGIICIIALPIIIFAFGSLVSALALSVLPLILIGIAAIAIIMFVISLFSKQ